MYYIYKPKYTKNQILNSLVNLNIVLRLIRKLVSHKKYNLKHYYFENGLQYQNTDRRELRYGHLVSRRKIEIGVHLQM